VPRAKRMQDQAATPLRASAATADPSETQEGYLAAFLAACVVGGVGVYITRYRNSGGIKLRLYIDGDSYEDVLNVSEEWGVLFDDYAKQAGVRPHYLALVKIFHRGRAESPQDAPDEAPPASDTPTPGAKALRGR
jgi:hypothetical protein